MSDETAATQPEEQTVAPENATETPPAQGDFHLRLSDDKVSVLLDCRVNGDDFDLVMRRAERELEKLGVPSRPPRSELEARVRAAAKECSELVDVVLFEGVPPIPAQDGMVEWTRDFFSTDFAVDDETGAIDYRQRTSQPQVEKDQMLARVLPPQEGVDGVDVFGEPVPVEKPNPARVGVGTNVREDPAKGAYYATADGRVRWSRNMLSVDTVYRVEGNVGLETGHIKHPGAVVIEGDVETGARIEAEGDIDVMGMVEAAEILAGGNLVVQGGISGTGGAGIHAGGSIHARFVLEADVQAGGDIVVEREILNSRVHTCGQVTMAGGRVVGGEVSALGGLKVRQAGTEAGVPTLLIAASKAYVTEQLALRERFVSAYEDALRRTEEALGKAQAARDGLSPEKKDAASVLQLKQGELREVLEQLQGELKAMAEYAGDRPKSEIHVIHEAFPETTLCVRDAKLKVTEVLEGPLRARYLRNKVQLLAARTV
jgi:hypothetical protein